MNTVAIIGGGFAGTLTAVNLIQQARSPFKIVLVERAESLGRGVAYSTGFSKHLLNVPAGRMSALPDEPLHFLKWARAKNMVVSESSYLSRELYGEYIDSILQSTVNNLPAFITFERLTDEALSIKLIQDKTKAVIKLASGDVIVADKVVLATGNFTPRAPSGISQSIALSERYINNPWKQTGADYATTGGEALLIGTGLTMIDKTIELVHNGFKGNIYAVSRHGLIPCAHSRASLATFAQTELNQDLYGDLMLLFKAVKETIRSGSYGHLFDNSSTVKMEVSDWRQVIDCLRPHSQALWASLNDKQKHRFLRHLRTYWDVHRHRMAPEIAEEINALIETGRLRVIRGRLYSVNETSEALIATIMPRAGGQPEQLKVGLLINCSGYSPDFRTAKNNLAQSLLTRSMVVSHPTGLGINVRPDGAILDAAGKPSRVLFTLGPPTLGLRGETVAVPEIRVQARELAKTLLQTEQTRELSVLQFEEYDFDHAKSPLS